MLSGSFLVYRIQLSLPRVISCRSDNHSAHPVRQWPESRVAYPTKVPRAALGNGKRPGELSSIPNTWCGRKCSTPDVAITNPQRLS